MNGRGRKHRGRAGDRLHVVLVGNPNVGKSCLFNYLTGLGVQVSNYPGTTVEVYKGKSRMHGTQLDIVDLPGTYAIDDRSVESRIVGEYLIKEKPDVVINMVDSNLLARNLYLTLQLKELGIPTVLALNFYEESRDAGVEIDYGALEKELGIPIVPIDALRGARIGRLMKRAIAEVEGHKNKKTKKSIEKTSKDPKLSTEIAKERHSRAGLIASSVRRSKKAEYSGQEKLDRLTTEPLSGTFILLLVLFALFLSLFLIGGFLEGVIINSFDGFIAPTMQSAIDGIPNVAIRSTLKYSLIWGLEAGLAIAIPYILVFYFFLAFLEDTGYMPRMGYLLDRFMHRIGLHGKAIVPMMLGFGCTVPALISTRLLESRRERIITAILLSFIPCSARTAIILGAVGFYLGWTYALSIYAILLGIMLVAGFVLSRWLPGEPEGLIMEMPKYRMPSPLAVVKKAWIRVKGFVYIAFPLLIIGSGILGLLDALNVLEAITAPFDPIIGGWLMLPSITGIALIYGILRKEMGLQTLLVLAGTANLLVFMTPLQIYVFALVSAIYIPCIATIGVLIKEFGWKNSLLIALSTILIAFLVGGVVSRLFPMLGLLS